jgi:c-di-GMP-binding flagellar brake protein YcgR
LEEHNVEERRRFHRLRHAQPVRFQFKDPSRFGGCLSCDLSEGGIRVHLNDFVPLYTELTVQIRLADESIVDCTGRVVWIEKDRFGDYYRAGLEFAGGGSIVLSQRKIHRFLSSQQRQPSPFSEKVGDGRGDAPVAPGIR